MLKLVWKLRIWYTVYMLVYNIWVNLNRCWNDMTCKIQKLTQKTNIDVHACVVYNVCIRIILYMVRTTVNHRQMYWPIKVYDKTWNSLTHLHTRLNFNHRNVQWDPRATPPHTYPVYNKRKCNNTLDVWYFFLVFSPQVYSNFVSIINWLTDRIPVEKTGWQLL